MISFVHLNAQQQPASLADPFVPVGQLCLALAV